MVERHLLALELAGRDGGPPDHLRPVDAFDALDGEGEDRHVDDLPQAWQPGDQLGDLAAPVELLAAVPVAVGGEEHHGFELPEPVQRAAGPEVR